MLERSELAENALSALHDENYDAAFNLQNLNADTLVFTGGRAMESLDGDWNFCVDLLDTGLRQKWFAMQPQDPADRTEPWDYDPYLGKTTPVPSCWAMQNDKWYFFEGSAWYTRPLDIASVDPEGRYFVHFGAAQYDCKLFLNGQFIGNHYGGSTPFCAELGGHLKAGRNWLMACVNNTRTTDRVPMRNTDWFNYGGIYREVALFQTPQHLIRDLFVYLVPDGTYGKIAIEVRVDRPGPDTVRVEIPGLSVARDIAVGPDGVARASIAATPELWSPETPRLYDVAARYGDDAVSDKVGFRQIERRGTEIVLNGQPVFLRGISVHEDDAHTGKVTSEEDLRRRFTDARALGCNFLRLAHYPHHERAARMADEMGLMLWEEIPVYWAIDFDNPAT